MLRGGWPGVSYQALLLERQLAGVGRAQTGSLLCQLKSAEVSCVAWGKLLTSLGLFLPLSNKVNPYLPCRNVVKGREDVKRQPAHGNISQVLVCLSSCDQRPPRVCEAR